MDSRHSATWWNPAVLPVLPRAKPKPFSKSPCGSGINSSDIFDGIESDSFFLEYEDMDELAVALTGLAEELHCDTGLWKSLETYHREFFGVSLPLLDKQGDPEPEGFDVRRFQFFLFSVWRHFQPDQIISPRHIGFRKIAQLAGGYFAKAFSTLPRRSAVTAFLSGSNRRGWEIKRKLIWLGSRSFLFRFAFKDYMRQQAPEPDLDIAVVDDFLRQECTEWSGLGALDILAATLDLPDADRAVLRGWHERHAAFYRIESWQPQGSQVETLEATNLINDQSYRVRMEIEQSAGAVFQPGQLLYASLVPWRGEWYWSGAQYPLALSKKDFAAMKRDFLRNNSAVAYRYCPDRVQRARDFAAEHLADFVRFHGPGLAVFPDGLPAAAAEQKRLRIFSEIKAGKDLANILRKYGMERPAQSMGLPQKFIESGKGVAVFYHEGEGTEMIKGYDILLSALGNRSDQLSGKEMEVLQAFIEEDTISPAFVRRVIQDAGSTGIGRLYLSVTGEDPKPDGKDMALADLPLPVGIDAGWDKAKQAILISVQNLTDHKIEIFKTSISNPEVLMNLRPAKAIPGKPFIGQGGAAFPGLSSIEVMREIKQAVSGEPSEVVSLLEIPAIWLGIPLRSLYQYVQQGFLPSYKLGRHRLFRKKELFSALSINRLAGRDEVLR
ncbi:MAG: helix-turn-helix domain-containing protein [Terrimicrobiaceae bacterium]